ncbi:MAG TPA: acetyl-CoA carboxylase biotin carboxyl carrier protein subunit [Bacteroidetes bacterium]|nr:acetyl-CoA carboxylase biotin carboxyl carrier protein subunit [Bacteroidota bacterium]
MEKKDKRLEKLNINYSEYTTRLSKKFKNRIPYKPSDKFRLLSFIPGTIIEIMVKEGDRVRKGDEVLVLEAMKMKNRIKSPLNGRVKQVDIKTNEVVPKGKLLIEFKPE